MAAATAALIGTILGTKKLAEAAIAPVSDAMSKTADLTRQNFEGAAKVAQANSPLTKLQESLDQQKTDEANTARAAAERAKAAQIRSSQSTTTSAMALGLTQPTPTTKKTLLGY